MKKPGLLIAFLHLLLFTYAQPGTLDSSFGNNGSVRTDSVIRCIAVQPNGKIIVAEALNDGFLISRFNADGALDNSFNGDGKVTTDFSGGGTPRSIAIQSNGKIVVVGASAGMARNTVIARYNPNGSLDSSFLANGKATLVLRWGAVSVAVHSDKKIVIAGGNGKYDSDSNFAVARLYENGSFDSSFNGNGVKLNHFGQSTYPLAHTVLIQPDGKILVFGAQAGVRIAIARYNQDGSSDNSFNGNGQVFIPGSGRAYFSSSSAILQHDGNIVVGGTSGVNFPGAENTPSFFLYRFRPDGSLNNTFGTDFGAGAADHLTALAVQEDGKIVASGYTSCFLNCGFGYKLPLARYNTDGSTDSTFGIGGKILVQFSNDVFEWPYIQRMAIHNKRIYVAGGYTKIGTSTQGIVAAFVSGLPNLTFTCPSDTTVRTKSGQCDAAVYNLDPIVNNNNAGITYKLTGATTGFGAGSVSGKIFNKGVTVVQYSLSNDSTKTCSFNITVEDKEAPVISCPPPYVLNYNTAGYTLDPLKVADNCDLPNITFVVTGATSRTGAGKDASGSFNPGISTITWQVEDSAGNSSTCSTMVTINNPQTINKLKVIVHPNPSKSSFMVTVKSDNTKQPIKINIYNLFGRIIEQRSVMSGQTIIIGYTYSPGIHVLEAVQGKQKEFTLLIKL